MGTGLAKLGDELTIDEVNRQIDLVLGDKGIHTVHDLIAWFEDGRAHLASSPKSAAQELGMTSAFMHAVLASNVFRSEYFRRIAASSFPPHVLADGMRLIAQDFLNPAVSVKDRLAIYRVVQELFGIEPTQRVKHEINQKKVVVEFKVQASPSDFVAEPLPASADFVEPGDGANRLASGDEGNPGEFLEETYQEAEEGDT